MKIPGAKITCLACGGKGYVARLTMDGTPRPILCKGCGGAGLQTIGGPRD